MHFASKVASKTIYFFLNSEGTAFLTGGMFNSITKFLLAPKSN